MPEVPMVPRRRGPGRIPQPVGDAPRGGKSRATAEARGRFLTALAEGGSIAGAARAAGRSVRACRDWREDPAFAMRWDEALQQAVASLEREAWRRAVEGTERPVVSGGKVVGTVRDYSDSLLALLLRAHAPERYARPAVAVGVQAEPDAPITFTFKIGDGPPAAIEGEAEP